MSHRAIMSVGDYPSERFRIYPLKITPREQQILSLVANDLTSKELAKKLHISLETVKSHRSSLIRKLGVKTTGGLVKRGFELGLLQV